MDGPRVPLGRTSLHAVVLAGGRGTRLRSVTGGTPKQFWRPDGQASLLDETLARIGGLVVPGRTTIVIGSEQERHIEQRAPASGEVFVQPEDRGTAAAVLFGLAQAADDSADAIALITPSDHAIADAVRFRRDILRAAAAVARGRADLVLFGATPHEPSADFGWLTLGDAVGPFNEARLRTVTTFVEKPPGPVARLLFARGAVWNTLVLVASVRALLRQYEQWLPDLSRAFRRYVSAAAPDRAERLRHAYRVIPSTDFSKDLLTHARGIAAMTWAPSIGWTDLGTPARLAAWSHARADRAHRLATAAGQRG